MSSSLGEGASPQQKPKKMRSQKRRPSHDSRSSGDLERTIYNSDMENPFMADTYLSIEKEMMEVSKRTFHEPLPPQHELVVVS